MADINRIKVVLVEKKKTNKWLAEQLGKDAATISNGVLIAHSLRWKLY
jgi:DNA-binding Xre family transcriptional regulator